MTLTTLGAFIALDLVLCIIPGPAVMAVVAAALGRERAGFATALGILTGNAVYFLVSALGVASVVVASHAAFSVVRWCGAAYLAYLGLRELTVRRTEVDLNGTAAGVAIRAARGWASGSMTQLANPKALVFFLAILPQFLDPRAELASQVVILGIASLVIELGVLSAYIAAAERIRRRGISPAASIWAQRVAGVILLGVAAAVIREST
jgi:threonine/homoserine/homoserine lactone efflux protein